MRTKALIIPLLATLLAVALVSNAYALTIRTVPYHYFNDTPWVPLSLEKNFTGAWTAYVYNYLTYNTTTKGVAILRLHSENASANADWMELNFWYDGKLDIYHTDSNGNTGIIGSGTWTAGEAIVISVTADGIIDIGNETDKEAIVKNYGVGDLDLYWVGGSTYPEYVNYTVTQGYINVEISGYASTTSDVSESVMVWIPIIVTFAMLGMVLGMIKKFSR
ncbi:MAG: hypothetical protein DRI61_05110 [Chloroflexi bacterium]|nr:MAG: hypothetical protein DRI61_05110 [Chloroflexota bacterium]